MHVSVSETRDRARAEVLLLCRRMQAEYLAYYTSGNVSKRSTTSRT